LIAKLRRLQFARHSEKLDAKIHQLELVLEDLEAHQAVRRAEQPLAKTTPQDTPDKPVRRPLPEHRW